MRTKTPEYYEYLHNRTPDQAITDAKATIEQILNAVNGGELAIHPFYHSILRHGKGFITDYQIEAGQQADHVWPIQLVRKKLAIIQWWHKVLVRIDNTICPIQTVYETCTTCPATLARLLSIPRDHINNPATNSEGDPCPICGQCEYRPEDGACVNCGDTTNAEKYKIEQDKGMFIKRIGKPCSVCGSTDRYPINGRCIACNRARAEKEKEKRRAAAIERETAKAASYGLSLEEWKQRQQERDDRLREAEKRRKEAKKKNNTPIFYIAEKRCSKCQTKKRWVHNDTCYKCSTLTENQAKKQEAYNARFYEGAPCLKCGKSTRFIKDNRCVHCKKQWEREKYLRMKKIKSQAL